MRDDYDNLLLELEDTRRLLMEAWEESEHFSQGLEIKIRRMLGIDPCDCEDCIRGAP